MTEDFSAISKVYPFSFQTESHRCIPINSYFKTPDVNIFSISKNTHRIILGPYNNINSLQKAFYSIRTLGFENIEIIKNG